MNVNEIQQAKMSIWTYLSSEVTRGYVLEADEERYTTRRQKIYTFMKIPRELEKFMSYGFFHCLDSFLFLFTFLPIRFMLAAIALVTRTPLIMLGIKRTFRGHVLYPAEIIDLLKGFIIAICVYLMHIYIDTSMMYHLIKSQSVIKLYLFYNMLEVGDRLFSAFGQDTIDALFWTATEPKDSKRQHVGLVPHFLLTVLYVILHSLLVLLQATTLNVAVNASNKALLTIMMSNNFVEIKGSVFKKFDKNNLFQVSCSDVRERFHLFSLLLVVIVQTMKEYGWKEQSFWDLAPDCLWVLASEFFVDWIKHAFITRFNEIPSEVYKDYTINLAYDLAQTKQKHAFSDHSDIVSRRMGFIPLPLSVVIIRVIGSAVKSDSTGTMLLFVLGYFCLLSLRILCSIIILGKACDLIDQHQQNKRSASIISISSKDIQKNEMISATLVTTDKNPIEEKLESSPESPTSEKVYETDMTFLSPSSTIENIIHRRRKNEDMNKDILPNYLSGSASPINIKTKEATNQELKNSAILLENKIEALFGKNKAPNSKTLQNKTPLNTTSDGIFFATEYVETEQNSSLEETNSNNSVFETKLDQLRNHKLDEIADDVNESKDHQNSSVIDLNDSKSKFENDLNEKSGTVENNDESETHSTPLKGIVHLLSNDNSVRNTSDYAKTEHMGWSVRRSQLLAAKQARTDSRRRPLSCTPPSTSIDHSSIDEDEESASISLQTVSNSSSVITSNTNTSSDDRNGHSNESKQKGYLSFSRSPSSSFEGLTATNIEENSSIVHECPQNRLIMRTSEFSKPEQILSQRDATLNSIAEKENESCDDGLTFSHDCETSHEVELPDICQQSQSEQPPPTSDNVDGTLKDCNTGE